MNSGVAAVLVIKNEVLSEIDVQVIFGKPIARIVAPLNATAAALLHLDSRRADFRTARHRWRAVGCFQLRKKISAAAISGAAGETTA